MTKPTNPKFFLGPTIRAIDPWSAGNPAPGRARILLSEEESARLATIASIVRFQKDEDVFVSGGAADAVYTIESGVVKMHRPNGEGHDHVSAFLFPGDVFGLSEEGRYVNSATAVTDMTGFRLPTAALRSRLSHDAALELHLISKLLHGLRSAQRHAFIINGRSAATKLAMFLQMLEQLQFSRDEDVSEILLPMTRADIGEYLSLSAAAVTRAFKGLSRQRVIEIRDLRRVAILDRARFDALAGVAKDRRRPTS